MELTPKTRSTSAERVDPGRRLRVMVVGLRGVVDIQGGIETHARMLYPLLAKLGCEIEVVQRRPYYPRPRRRRRWRGLQLTYLWTPTLPVIETAVHSLLAILYAGWKRPDVVHLHAIGPGLLVPLARALGLRTVFTHHAIDYDREKWGPVSRSLLRAGEQLGVRFANRPIVVSPAIRDSLRRRMAVSASLIPNGAPKATRAASQATLERFGLTRGRYVLCVARLERTKRQLDLLAAFRRAQLAGWKLVIVGALEPEDEYSMALKAEVGDDAQIVLTGYQSGTALREIYTHAGVFVLPSSSEGHPIALLEAMSFGVPVLASEIPANRSLPIPEECYFPVGDVTELERLLREVAANPNKAHARLRDAREAIRTFYSWKRAARLTRSVYDDAVGNGAHATEQRLG